MQCVHTRYTYFDHVKSINVSFQDAVQAMCERKCMLEIVVRNSTVHLLDGYEESQQRVLVEEERSHNVRYHVKAQFDHIVHEARKRIPTETAVRKYLERVYIQ